jgi:hypothetical protein
VTEFTNVVSQPKWFTWRFIRFVFSVFLLVTAFLKFRDFGSPSALFDIAPSLEFGLIQLEVLIALWLLSGWKTIAAWFCTLCLFATFAGASLALVVQKKATCGCFGSVDFNPAWVFVIDIVAISTLLLVGRIENNRVVDPSPDWIGFRLKQRILSLTMGISLIAITIGFAGIYFNTHVGSWYARNLPIALTGQVLVTEPSVVAASPGVEGNWQTLSFSVVNRGKESVRLIGAEQNCKCRAIKSLPIVVPAAGQVDIEVDVKLGSKSSFALLTTSQQQARLVCRWRESE